MCLTASLIYSMSLKPDCGLLTSPQQCLHPLFETDPDGLKKYDLYVYTSRPSDIKPSLLWSKKGFLLNETIRESVRVPVASIRKHIQNRRNSLVTTQFVVTPSGTDPVLESVQEQAQKGTIGHQFYGESTLTQFGVRCAFF